MPEPLRVVHYINAFFGGRGGEEEAHAAVSLRTAPWVLADSSGNSWATRGK
jgi:hypothetical protein